TGDAHTHKDSSKENERLNIYWLFYKTPFRKRIFVISFCSFFYPHPKMSVSASVCVMRVGRKVCSQSVPSSRVCMRLGSPILSIPASVTRDRRESPFQEKTICTQVRVWIKFLRKIMRRNGAFGRSFSGNG